MMRLVTVTRLKTQLGTLLAARRSARARRAFAAALLATALYIPAPARAAFVETPEDNTFQNNTLIQSDEVLYDDDANTVTATGHVEIQRGNRILLADQIVYDRNTDIAVATGHVSMLDDSGAVFFFEKLEVAGDLKQGIADEVRVLLSDKSRMASRAFRRRPSDVNELYEATYTPCDSCDPHSPVWQIKARQVRYDRDAQMVYYDDAWLEFKGLPIFYTPYLAHPDPTAGPTSGLLLPAIGGNQNLGAFYKQPYFIAIAPDQDATVTPFITSDAGQGAIFEYRQDFEHGQVRLDGSIMGNDPGSTQDVRGHFIGWSRFDLDENWRAGTNINLASDQTYLRVYNFKAPTWETSNVYAERFTQNSYFSVNTYYFENQQANVAQSSVPIVTPAMAYNYVTDPDSLGGYWSFDAGSMVLFRPSGTDSDRLSARAGWNLPYTTSWGSVFTFRTDVVADGYYVHDVLQPNQTLFNGVVGRALPEASLEWQMPFVSDQLGFHQVIEPIVMVAVSPIGTNSTKIPDEDALDLDFDDTNLFSMNQFSGYDRVDTGARVSYGVHYSIFQDNIGTVSAQLGQMYRFHADSEFVPLSGLTGNFSDFVGHIDYSPNALFNLQYRFRFDKDNFATRLSEVTATVGPDLARFGASYIMAKADADNITTLGSTEELFVYLSSRFSQHWSVNASHRQNLGPNGGPIRSDLGVTYEDECIVIGFDVANDNTADRDFKAGLQFMLRFNLKTIGDIKFNSGI